MNDLDKGYHFAEFLLADLGNGTDNRPCFQVHCEDEEDNPHGNNNDDDDYSYCWLLVTTLLSTSVSPPACSRASMALWRRLNEAVHPACVMLN